MTGASVSQSVSHSVGSYPHSLSQWPSGASVTLRSPDQQEPSSSLVIAAIGSARSEVEHKSVSASICGGNDETGELFICLNHAWYLLLFCI